MNKASEATAKAMLDQIAERNQARATAKKVEAKVGIFWAVNGKLILESLPLTEAEIYGEFRNHPWSHERCWDAFQWHGVVPHGVEYEEFPRGRVIFNQRLQQYYLYADPCILQKPEMVSTIMKSLRLPSDTEVRPDEHYRCESCLRGMELD